MRAIAILLFLLCSQVAFSQDTTSTVHLGFQVMVNRSQLRFNDSDAQMATIARMNKDVFKPGNGVGGVVQLQMRMHKRWWLTAGVGYELLNVTTDTLKEVQLTKARYTFQGLFVPVTVRFHAFQREHSSAYVGAGIQTDFWLSRRSSYKLEGSNQYTPSVQVENFSRFLFSARVEMGMKWSLSGRWSADLGLNYSFGLNDVTTSSLQTRLNGYMLHIGLFRHL